MGIRNLCLLVCVGTSLTACNTLGLCHSESLDAVNSPQELYTAEIVATDCVGQAPVQKVTLSKLNSRIAHKTTIAVYENSNPDLPVEVRLRWQDDNHLTVSGNGAHMWMFQTKWHDVDIRDR